MRRAFPRILRGLLLCGLTSVGIYGGASCGSSDTGGTGAAGGAAARPDMVFEGDANATALAAITAVDGPVNPATYAVFDLPAEGAVYSDDLVPKFTWHMNAQPVPPPDAGAFFLLPAPAAPAARAVSLGPLLDLFGKERGAAAAGNAVNGLGYLLLFSTAKASDLLRVFTTKTSYTPGPATLEIMRDVGETIQVWILTGVFDNDALTSYGGPFRGPWTSFEVTN